MHFGILCDVKLGLKAGTRYSLNVWLGNQGIKVDEWFPAELLLLNCSAVGFYPRAGTWSQTLLWDFESGRCSIRGGTSRGSPWKQDELASACDSKKWFSQRVCEYSGLVWGWFF